MSSDNYDDLDDLLDDNELQSKILAESPAPKASGDVTAPSADKTPAVPPSTKEDTPSKPPSKKDNNDLPKELEELLRSSGDDPQAQEALKTLLAGLSLDEPDSEHPEEGADPKTFEDTISATMDRLNQSKKGGAGADLDEADLMEKLLQDMQKSIGQEGGDGTGAGGLDGLLSTLLAELSSKSVLYDPLKELHTSYPEWLAKNRESLDKDELQRLERQQTIVAAVIEKFEEPSYSDSDRAARDYITEKMVEMQDTGAPPKELVGDVAGGAFPGIPGLGAGAAPDLPGDCATQ